MPIYEYRCECGNDREILLSFGEYNQPQTCECGEVMQRRMSVPRLAIFKVYPKDKIADTLNGEDKYATKDGRPVRSKRSQKALASGLDYVKPLEEKVFQGFG